MSDEFACPMRHTAVVTIAPARDVSPRGPLELERRNLAELRQAWARTPHDAELGYSLGIALYEAGALDEARQVLVPACQATRDPDQVVRMGRVLEYLQCWNEASEAYTHALQCDPLHADALGFMAALTIRQDGLQPAISGLRKWASLSEHPVQAHFGIAKMLLEDSCLAEAADHLQIALDLDPLHIAAQELLGTVLGQRGDDAGSVQAWRVARQIRPDSPETAAGLGMALSRVGDHEAAIELLSGLGGPSELTCLGRSFRETGDVEGALVVLNEALEIHPDSFELHAELGWTAFVSGDYVVAAEGLQRAADLAPKSGLVHYRLGKVLSATNRRPQALASLLKAAALLPEDESVQADLLVTQNELRGLKVGSDDIEMTGHLDIVGLPDLLEFFSINSASGELCITSAGQQASIFLLKGRICAAHSTESPCLGELLVQTEEISQEALEAARGKTEDKTVAKVLVDDGLVDSDKMQERMEEQILGVLAKAAAWTGGDFTFCRDQTFTNKAHHEYSLDTRFALMEVMRQIDEAGAGRA